MRSTCFTTDRETPTPQRSRSLGWYSCAAFVALVLALTPLSASATCQACDWEQGPWAISVTNQGAPGSPETTVQWPGGSKNGNALEIYYTLAGDSPQLWVFLTNGFFRQVAPGAQFATSFRLFRYFSSTDENLDELTPAGFEILGVSGNGELTLQLDYRNDAITASDRFAVQVDSTLRIPTALQTAMSASIAITNESGYAVAPFWQGHRTLGEQWVLFGVSSMYVADNLSSEIPAWYDVLDLGNLYVGNVADSDFMNDGYSLNGAIEVSTHDVAIIETESGFLALDHEMPHVVIPGLEWYEELILGETTSDFASLVHLYDDRRNQRIDVVGSSGLVSSIDDLKWSMVYNRNDSNLVDGDNVRVRLGANPSIDAWPDGATQSVTLEIVTGAGALVPALSFPQLGYLMGCMLLAALWIRRRSVRTSALVVLQLALVGWLALPPTAATADILLASYESTESPELSLSSPDAGMTLTWPVLGGAAGVPAATEGSHVLKLAWTGETDRKVEVRHDWASSTFDLAGQGGILIDVYVDTASALPAIAGIYDDVFFWLEGFDLPTTTGQWYTLAMCVADKGHVGLNHILATLFEDVAGDDGTIYLDNLRLVPPKQLSFAGRNWTVKCGVGLGPGPNDFSQGAENVWVDGNGRLHLKIIERRGQWWCAEVVLNDSLGYGAYSFELETRVDLIDEIAVLGLFTYDLDAAAENYREIDIEFSKWGNPENDNGQYVIQPYTVFDNIYRFDVDYSGAGGDDTTTHTFSWGPGAIDFESSYGAIPPPDPGSIQAWPYSGVDIPDEGAEQTRLNLWLFQTAAPANGQDVEVVISDFRFIDVAPGVPVLGVWGLLGLAVVLAGVARQLLRGG